MALIDGQITLQEIAGSTFLSLDVLIMPVTHIDHVERNQNGLTYLIDVAEAAFIPEVAFQVLRCAITREEFAQLWDWMIAGTDLSLIDLANNLPIASYNGKLARLQADAFHEAKIGRGPFEFVFKPDSAAAP